MISTNFGFFQVFIASSFPGFQVSLRDKKTVWPAPPANNATLD